MAISKKSSERRIGRFHIDRHLIDNQPEDVLRLLRDILIVRAEMRYDRDAIEYVGISENFAPVPEGCITPEYYIEEEVERTPLDSIDGTREVIVTSRTRRFVPYDEKLRSQMPDAPDRPHMEIADTW